MADQPEVIQRELEQTRSALADKLEIIGDKISGTVENVTDSVESVTSAVENTVEAVSETVGAVGETAQETVQAVRHALDIPEQVRRYPWMWMCGAVAAGFVAGKILTVPAATPSAQPRKRKHVSSYGRTYAGRAAGDFFAEHPQERRHTNGFSPTEPDDATEPAESKSWLGTLTEKFGPEISKLKGLALGTLFGVTRDMISQSLPQSVKTEVANVIDNITASAGGKPIQGHVLDNEAGDSQSKGADDGKSDDAEMERPVGTAQGQGQAGLGRPHRR